MAGGNLQFIIQLNGENINKKYLEHPEPVPWLLDIRSSGGSRNFKGGA
jgi:hypothetical protein